MGAVRLILGLLVGVALGMGIVMAGDALNHRMFPPPPPEQVHEYLTNAPVINLVGLPIAYTLAALAAAFTAAKIGARQWAGWVAGGVLVAGTIANLIMIVHPLWMTVACAIFVPLAAWLGARFGSSRRA